MTTCITNSDCPQDNPICNISRGLCFQCNYNQDCDIGYSCVDNKCTRIPVCQEDADCVPYDPYLKCKKNIDNFNICVGCLENKQCSFDQKCENNKCVSTAILKPCKDGKCDKGYECVNGFCRKIEYIYLYITLIAIALIILLVFIQRLIK